MTTARAKEAEAPSEDELARGGLIVEHYRVDASAALGHALGWSSLVRTIGGVVTFFILPRVGAWVATPSDAMFRLGQVTADGTPIERPLGLELALALIGIVCVAIGGAVAIVGLRRVLTEESYLALRTDGAYFQQGTERGLVRWEDVEAVRWDASARVLRFERHDGSAWTRAERFAGIDGPELAKRASEIRRKALFGLLPTRRR